MDSLPERIEAAEGAIKALSLFSINEYELHDEVGNLLDTVPSTSDIENGFHLVASALDHVLAALRAKEQTNEG